MATAVAPSLAPIALGVGLKPQLQRANTFAAGCGSHVSSAGNMPAIDDRPMTSSRNLSIIEVESKLRECIRAKYHDVLQTFQSYDEHRCMSVSKGQFRRVLEVHFMPLTSDQFEAILNKADVKSDGTVRYCDFMDKFCGTGCRAQSADRWNGTTLRCSSAAPISDSRPDIIEKMLQEKVQSRMTEILESLRLYDFNHDGVVLSHNLHRVLDKHCFVISDSQFNRIYKKYDLRRNGTVNYKEFLGRLGVRFERTSQNQNGTVVVGSRPASVNSRPAAVQPEKPVTVYDEDLNETEVAFRSKMRNNYANIKRMFMVFDRHLDGFISIDDLRSVLNNFTVPMSDQMFSELMNRFGFKASGKISWESFLYKFQDPLAQRNGQTLPIRPAHRFNPVMGADETLTSSDVVKLLVKRVKDGYSTLRSAFLQLDKNRDGKITRKELRELLEVTFAFRLSPEHFRDLMLLLDPEQTNTICYHDFLELFEARETLAGHKWLNTCHRTNAHRCPVVAWSTLEDNIRDQIEQHRADVVDELERRAAKHPGRITLKSLRKVIEMFAVSLSDEHFKDMTGRLIVLDEAGLVDYERFFATLGVVLNPSDSTGISAQIINGSQQTAADHDANHQLRMQSMKNKATDRTGAMETEEIIVKLRDKMSQRSANLHAVFKHYANKHRGRITKRDFRKILESFGFQMPDDQFAKLCDELSFTGSYMNYIDFVRSFEGHRAWTSVEASGASTRPPNHRVNEIRGDEMGFPSEELLGRLRQKFDQNFQNLHDVFNKFDENKDGLLTKTNFRHMLDSFMLLTTDEEFEKFCKDLGVTSKSRISYEDFLEVFQVKETKDGHKWLTSVHRFNQARVPEGLGADETLSALKQKIYEKWHDMAKAFRSIAAKHNGTVSKSDLSNVMKKFGLHMSAAQLRQLWMSIHGSEQGSVSFDDFAKYFIGNEFTPGDQQGLSKRIVTENRQTLKELRDDQVRRQQENRLNEANHVSCLSVDDVILQLRNRFQDHFSDLQAAFKRFDSNNKGYLTSRDFQTLLGEVNLLVDDDLLFDLFESLQLSSAKSKLYYDDFVRLFEEGQVHTFRIAEVEDAEYPMSLSARIPVDVVEARLRRKIQKHVDELTSAFSSVDRQGNGIIRTVDLRRIVDMFCFKMTDVQFRHIMKVFSCTKLPYDAQVIDYRRFIDRFTDNRGKAAGNGFESLHQTSLSDGCLNPDELLSVVRRGVNDNWTAVERAFADVDYAELGVVSRRDFHDVICAHVAEFSDEQFEVLWSNVPVNEFSNLDYRAFLAQCKSSSVETAAEVRRPSSSAARMVPPATPQGLKHDLSRPSTAATLTGRVGSAAVLRIGSSVRPYTPLVDAVSPEAKIRDRVRRQWKSFQRDCREADSDNTSLISQQEFKRLAKKYDFGLTEDEVDTLLVKYDLTNTNRFSYADFLRRFIINSSSLGVSSSSNGGRLESSRPPSRSYTATTGNLLRQSAVSGATNVLQCSIPDGGQTASSSALEKVRECVFARWKDMRRELRSVEPLGYASAEQFRQALRNANVDLDEDDFFDILVRFEDRKTRKIHYDDFFRYFLQAT